MNITTRMKSFGRYASMLIMATILSISANMANAHGRPMRMPPPPPHHRHHHHHGAIVPLPLPIVVGGNVVLLPPVRVWIPGAWIEERDIYGRLVGRRWIPGHWEYR